MDQYKLTFLPLFYDDLDKIVTYISLNLKNPEAAAKLIDDVENAINARLTSPTSYSSYKSKKDRKTIYYKIHHKNYYIFYVVFENNKTMEVRRIIYDKRNYQKLI